MSHSSSMPSLTLQDTLGVPGADRPLPMGYRLQGFELQALVARYGVTDVHRALDSGLDATVLIEEYMPRHLARRDALGRIAAASAESSALFRQGLQVFIEESRALSRCDHPCLLKVVHLFESNGTAYRVMPVYQGTPLADVRQTMSGPPDQAGLRSLLESLLDALHTYHAASGMAHGEVNPSNIWLLEDDTPLLLAPNGAQRVCLGGTHQAKPVRDALAAMRADVSGDLRAIALLARFCISGEALLASTEDQTLSTLVSQLFFDRPQLPYDSGLLRALDAALSDQVEERPRSALELLEWLKNGPPPQPSSNQVLSEAQTDAIARAVSSVSRPADMNDQPEATRLPPLTEFMGREAPAITVPGQPAGNHTASTPVAPASTTTTSQEPMPKESSSLAAQSLAAAATWEDTVAEPRAYGRAAAAAAAANPNSPFSSLGQTATPRRPFPFTSPLSEHIGYGEAESNEHIQLGDDFLRSSPAPGGPSLTSGQPRKFAAMWGFVALGLAVVLALAVWQWMIVPAIEVPSGRNLDNVVVSNTAASNTTPVDQASPPTATPGLIPATAASAAAVASSTADVTVAAAVKTPLNPFQNSAGNTATASTTTVVTLSEAASAVAANELAPKVPLDVIPTPAEIKQRPPRPTVVAAAAPKPTSPRQQCGSRTEFALYRCMQTQCTQGQWSKHPQCLTLKETDEVVE
jgi:serine/threonine protein kinase